MKQVIALVEVKKLMNGIRDTATDYLTNWYADDISLSTWIRRGQIWCDVYEAQTSDGKLGKVLFLLRHRAKASTLYFFATSVAAFYAVLPRVIEDTVSYGPMALNIVEKGGCVANELQAQGYPLYRTLSRMRYLKWDDASHPPEDDRIAYAIPEEAGEICQLLQITMDPYCEQVPDVEDIVQAIARQEVLVYHHDREGTIEAVLTYHLQRSAVQWEFWATHPKWRHNCNGMKLYDVFRYNMRNKKCITIWTRDDNPVRKLHHYFHAKEDGLRDTVFLFHVSDRGRTK